LMASVGCWMLDARCQGADGMICWYLLAKQCAYNLSIVGERFLWC
jgi:hypothetical protein